MVEELRSNLDAYAYTLQRTHAANQLQEIYRDLGNGKEAASERDRVSVAGRRNNAAELYVAYIFMGRREYEIGRIFQNEALSTRRNPEVTIIEV